MKRMMGIITAVALLVCACGANEKAIAPEGSNKPAASAGLASSAVSAVQNEVRGFAPPEMSEEQAQYNRDCVMPLLSSGLLLESWSAENDRAFIGQEAKAKMIFAFEDITGRDEMQKLFQSYDGLFPAEVIEVLLLERFPFTIDQLHEMMAEQYRADEKIYYYEGGRGGGPVDCAVTDVRIKGEQIQIEYCWMTGWAGYELDGKEVELYSIRTTGTLTVTRNADGKFRYLSVEVSDREELIES